MSFLLIPFLVNYLKLNKNIVIEFKLNPLLICYVNNEILATFNNKLCNLLRIVNLLILR